MSSAPAVSPTPRLRNNPVVPDILRMRRHLDADLPSPAAWPNGTRLATLDQVEPLALHAILADAYANGFGSVPAFAEWWPSVETDEEFDPALVFVAVDADGAPIGLALCWSAGFIKDIAVVPAWRGKGVGDALLQQVFGAFLARGLPHVDLKVIAANASAIRLYHRAGMIEAPL